MLHVVMIRTGTKYGPDYVSILSDMLARNLSELDDVTPWIVTDDPHGVPDGLNIIPAHPELPGWWQKPYLFSPDMPWAIGDRIAYFDLDSVIVGRLEPLVERKGIIRDWNWPGFNSSVMVWDHGEHAQIWSDFTMDLIDRPARLQAHLPAGQVNGGDQEWIYEAAPDFPTFPEAWCVSYKLDAEHAPPRDARVVCFHGQPKPHEIATGWVADMWRIGGFTQLPKMDGANVSDAVIRQNVLDNLKRDIDWFSGYGPRKESAVVVCGGPSMADHIADIRWRKRNGARIITVNNSWRVLAQHGVLPDSHVMLDARPENAAFLDGCPEKTRYLIASQCDVSVFDALEGREVLMWHNMAHGMEAIFEPHIEAMMLRKPGAKAMLPVPGGGTVGLRALNLCWMSGYRKIHVYGLDGSFRDGKHHAYDQALNDDDQPIEVQLGIDGKRYWCARWMVRQAEEFRETHAHLTRMGVQLFVHGSGLIPDLAASMKMAA